MAEAFQGSVAPVIGFLASMNRLAHRRTRRTVSAFVDGELDDAAAEVVAAHLRECWGCSGDVELERMVKRSLSHLGRREDDALARARLRRFATGLAN